MKYVFTFYFAILLSIAIAFSVIATQEITYCWHNGGVWQVQYSWGCIYPMGSIQTSELSSL